MKFCHTNSAAEITRKTDLLKKSSNKILHIKVSVYTGPCLKNSIN